MAIRNKIRDFRNQTGLTQEELAAKADVSRQTINAVENEKYSPSLALALRLGEIFDKPVEELFERSE